MVRVTAVGLFCVSLVACGGTAIGGEGDAGRDATSDAPADGQPVRDSSPDAASDASSDAAPPWSPVCPALEPTVGAPCSLPSPRDSPQILCEYGTLQFDVSCDAVYTCEAGTWAKSPSFGPCQPDGPNGPSCPSTLAGASGSCSDEGTQCEYPDGVCRCSPPFGGPIELDAGLAWNCNPGPGCPVPRPRLGAACTGSTQACQYLTCSFGESCTGGYWEALFEGCAKAGGSP